MENRKITRELYEGFQRGDLGQWDAIFSQDVIVKSPGMREGMHGIEGFKKWAAEFLTALEPQIDLVDEYENSTRAFIAVNLHWKHVKPFFHIQATGREGTSIEYFILKINDGKVIELQVADASLDLAIYLWDRGWPQAHGLRPEPIIRGLRRSSLDATSRE